MGGTRCDRKTVVKNSERYHEMRWNVENSTTVCCHRQTRPPHWYDSDRPLRSRPACRAPPPSSSAPMTAANRIQCYAQGIHLSLPTSPSSTPLNFVPMLRYN